MSSQTESPGWVSDFRRMLPYLRPHRRALILGLVAAIGVSATYTISISSVIPLLKVIFADHETLVDWLHRSETERRLGVSITADLPDDPAGLRIGRVREESANADALNDGDRIVSLAGDPPGAYALMRRITESRATELTDVRVTTTTGPPRTINLALKPYHWWSRTLRSVASILPTSPDRDGRLKTLGYVMTALVIVTLVGGLFRLANEGLIAVAVQNAMHDVRSELADHVLRLPLAWHSRQPPGDTLARFANDIGKVEMGMTTLFGRAFREPLKAAGVLVLTLAIDWSLLLVAVVGLPIGALAIGFFGRVVKRAQRRASQSWGRLLDHLGEKLAGIRVVKAYGMQSAEASRFENEDRTLTRAQKNIEFVEAATKPALETLAMIAVAMFVIYGAYRVFSGQLEPQLFFGAIVCLGGVFDPVRKLAKVNNRLQAADVSARRLLELRDATTEDQHAVQAAAADTDAYELELSEQIEFRDIGFVYPSAPQRPVLADINLNVRKGQVVALVGPNGSGKTTLMALLLRFFEPTSGEIRIDGRPLIDIPLEQLRGLIGLVTQEAVVFADTVRANIAYGANGDVDDAMIRRAAQRAHVDEFINTLEVRHEDRITRGYDAFVSARSLSGGQRQRLAIARAILRDPPILILDEATSQVDSESERRIQEALEEITQDRTTFVIAHRYSTIARADVTVVLNEGRLVSYGKHAELLETCPFYVSLCQTQFAQAT